MKISIWIYIFMSFISLSNAQNGLESVIVETYYVSDAKDTLENKIGGKLPIGSTTYRIFVDMLPGYELHTVYGNKNHEMIITTTTSFFNNEDIGNVISNVIPRRKLKNNTVMLDSWLSVGAAGENMYGVMKEDDDSIETIILDGPCLKNLNPSAGIPLTKRDGLKASEKVARPTFFKIDSIANIFNSQTIGSRFSTKNGAWGCLGGAAGLDSLGKNKVLIAQLTTNGKLNFELNIQVGKPNEKPEKYVARNPIENEIQLPSLIFESKLPNTVTSRPIKNKK